jgi:hypothetical protein
MQRMACNIVIYAESLHEIVITFLLLSLQPAKTLYLISKNIYIIHRVFSLLLNIYLKENIIIDFLLYL